MQIKLNQYEIQQALTEFIQKRSSSKITLTAFDLKGMRSEEGYHANVEIEYEDVSYEEIVPKSVSFASTKNEEHKTEPVKQSEPEMTEEARTVILEVLNLMNTNVQHCNTAKLIRLVEKGTEEVQKYFENSPTYKATVEDFKGKVEIEPVKEEEETVSEEEEITSIEPVVEEEEKEEGEEKESTLDILNPSISQGETAIKLNIFGKPIGSDTVATKPIFG